MLGCSIFPIGPRKECEVSQLIDSLQKINPTVGAAIVGAVAGFITALLTRWLQILADRYSLNYKLSKEFAFEQKRHIKQEISGTKMSLLNAAEELNFRLWNFSSNIAERWHNKDESEWSDPHNYYLHSFVYRLLVFLNLAFEADRSVQTYDSTLFSRKDRDIVYLKYVKSFKNFFCDVISLKEFDYEVQSATHHFFRDHLSDSVRFVSGPERTIINFSEYLTKIRDDWSQIRQMLEYVTSIEREPDNINYNMIMGFHLMLMTFLNNFGHDYQVTIPAKIKGIIADLYYQMTNKANFVQYLARCKIHRDFRYSIHLLISNRIKRRQLLKDGYLRVEQPNKSLKPTP